MKESIYTLKLVRKGIDIQEGKEINILKSISVKEVMNSDVETVPESLPMGKLADIVSRSKYNSFPVLDEAGKLKGILSHVDYRDGVFDENLKDLVVVKDLTTFQLVTVSTEDSLNDALEKISVRDFSSSGPTSYIYPIHPCIHRQHEYLFHNQPHISEHRSGYTLPI